MLNPPDDNPLIGIFEEGMEEFQGHQRAKDDSYKTRRQKFNQKLEKLEADLNDPEQKRERNRQRRQAEKDKIKAMTSHMDEGELKQFMKERKKEKDAKKQKAKEAMLTGEPILFDLAYMDMMSPVQSKSLAKQIHLITKVILHVDNVPSLHICSLLPGEFKEQLGRMGYQFWPVTPHEQNVSDVAQELGKKVVYLSPDAQQCLEQVEPGTAYILGGLVDRTVIRDASVHRARELGIPAKKLPIRQYMKNRYCLNLDHVVMMLCKFKECHDWKEAFEFGAPKRWKKDAESELEKKEVKQQGEGCSESEEQQQK